jgi:predicted RNA-binding protein with PIN domain
VAATGPMPYLIDGNNLLGLRPELISKDPGARARLVHRLAGFARDKRTRVTVVFDGEPDETLGREEMELGDLRVLFAGRTADADSRILRILREADDPAGYVVVTSDRALAERVKRFRSRQITSLSFRRSLDETVPRDPAGDAPLSPAQVAEWEAWFTRNR